MMNGLHIHRVCRAFIKHSFLNTMTVAADCYGLDDDDDGPRPIYNSTQLGGISKSLERIKLYRQRAILSHL